MKKLFSVLVFLMVSFVVDAQTMKFGYFSFDTVLKSMPEYVVAQRDLADLRSKYILEAKRVEDEFNKKYEQFLDGQRDFAPSILRKRQAELQELMDKNVTFKQDSKHLLEQAENDMLTPLKNKLSAAVKKIGAEHGYAFVLNTDGDAVPYVDSSFGEDINVLVKDALK
jgi:outer membrane protein